MASRSLVLLALVGLAPGAAAADGLVLPGLGPQNAYPRPSYNEAYDDFPPPQHNILGLPVPPPSPYDRPSYRESYDNFPPPGGRYGGGFIEYVITGGRPEPVPEPAPEYAPPAPVYAAPAYAAPAYAPAYPPAAPAYEATAPRGLPRSGLPDYLPEQPAATDLGPQSMGAPAAAPQLAAYEPAPAMDPIYQRQAVAYAGRERPGTIIIDTPHKFLFLVEARGQALRYGIGVGRPGFSWAGVKSITRKAEWPGWTPPRQMLARRPDLPRHMDGGQENPLGARALYLGSSLYRIHGTNQPYTIGTNVSSGCIRMMNEDVIDLYGRVGVGTRVVVM